VNIPQVVAIDEVTWYATIKLLCTPVVHCDDCRRQYLVGDSANIQNPLTYFCGRTG
jgi:hypothetical protein